MSAAVNVPLRSTLAQGLISRLVSVLNPSARALAWVASKVSPVTDAGVFFYRDLPPFWDAWRDDGGIRIRLGRVEVMIDFPSSLPTRDE